MSLKPTDLQIMIPKTTEISRIQQQRELSPQNEQYIEGQIQQQQFVERQQQVQQSFPNRELTDRHAQKSQYHGGKYRKLNKKEKAMQEEENLDPLRGHNFDMKL